MSATDEAVAAVAEAAVKEFAELAKDALPKLAELLTHLGSRDAVLATLDGALVTARKKTDADLRHKHEHDHDTPPGGTGHDGGSSR